MKRNKSQVRKRKVTRVLGLLTRANAIHCRVRGLSLIPPDDGISGGWGICGADPGNWGTWSPCLTHSYYSFLTLSFWKQVSYYRFSCSRICGSYSKGSSRAIWKVSLWYVLAGKERGRDFTKSISCVALLNLCRCTLPQIFCLNWSGCFLCVLGSLRFPSIFTLLKRNLFYNCDKNIT